MQQRRKSASAEDDGFVKVGDFGLAKIVHSDRSETQSGPESRGIIGTPEYMPPEQIRNFRDVRPQSDIYAVGMTAYSLLTGEIALNLAQKSSMAETIKAIFEQPTIPMRQRAPHVPSAVCEIIDRALHKDPAQRWQSAAPCVPH